MAAKTFTKGDRVAWAKAVAHMHGSKSVVLASALLSVDGSAKFGAVSGHDDVGHPIVVLDNGETWTLTNEELVRIEE